MLFRRTVDTSCIAPLIPTVTILAAVGTHTTQQSLQYWEFGEQGGGGWGLLTAARV